MLEVAGKPLVLHTLDQAKKVPIIDAVLVATDDMRIFAAVKEAGGEVVMTSPNHLSGTDRVAEAARKFAEDSIIVNVQGDEPLIPTSTIQMAVKAIQQDTTADIVTTFEPIADYKEVFDPGVVKMVLDAEDYAMYFSRSPIPYLRDEAIAAGGLEEALRGESQLLRRFKKHTGMYVYRNRFLQKLTTLDQTDLERYEMLEQLRALQNQAKIKLIEATEKSIGVDTDEDLNRVREILEARTQ
jgi:3-deoxy-manno-octulosonate cytidylyltransferase (CMP-KDO synthetase)